MKPKSKRTEPKYIRTKSRPARKPGRELAHELEDECEKRANAWEVLREELERFMSERETTAASRVIARGGLSLLDLQGIEFAEFMWLSQLQKLAVEAMTRGEKTGTFIGTLSSVRLASRKNMRTLAVLMNPTYDENATHPTIPAEIAGLYNTEAYGADDLGDELLS